MQSRPSQTRYCARIHCRTNSRLIFSSSISNFKTIFFWCSCPHQSKLYFNVLRCQKKTREAFFRFEDFYFILVSLFPEIRFYIATFNLKFHFENCFCLFRVDIGEFLKKWQRIKKCFCFWVVMKQSRRRLVWFDQIQLNLQLFHVTLNF